MRLLTLKHYLAGNYGRRPDGVHGMGSSGTFYRSSYNRLYLLSTKIKRYTKLYIRPMLQIKTDDEYVLVLIELTTLFFFPFSANFQVLHFE